jgi:hypothetical protein
VRALLFAVVLLILVGGGVWASADAERADREPAEVREPARTPEPRAPRRRRSSPPARPLRASKCPDGVAGCREISGRVVFVESVDPDGDGDLHVVLAGDDGLSGPGITAVDIAPALRPRRDPRVGDSMSAAGPVQRGSYGQSQVHALEMHLRRR